MGSTGHSIYKKGTKSVGTETFGIKGATVYKGKIPEGKGLEPQGSNKITLKVPAVDKSNVLFQFKMSRDEKLMTIIGYKNGIPEVRCKVAVDSGQPSLDKVIASGSKAQKIQAVKMKNLFSQSTDIKENQLGSIANKLLREKEKKGSGR